MIIDRQTGAIEHRIFQNLMEYLNSDDLLVMNNTRVLPARLVGKKESGGKIEVLLIPPWNGVSGEWKALIKGSAKVKPKIRIQFDQGIEGVLDEVKQGKGRIYFSCPGGPNEVLRKIGHIPLPPYIKRADEPFDRERYQTVFAEQDGSIAAPTAGLHFTNEMLRLLKERGVRTTTITLHVGIGTFAPVKSEQVEDHKMETEWFEISEESAAIINDARARGGKVIAVGTTTTRALESFADGKGDVTPGSGMTSLFIYPPYRFRVIDALITNFHLPRSTLIMLASAFAGKDLLSKAYREAIHREYRFYSYGDAMLII